MHIKKTSRIFPSRILGRTEITGLKMMVVSALTVLLALSMQAQSYKVIYTFDSGTNAWAPAVGLSIDSNGNLYGTTIVGGGQGDCPPHWLGCGTVFQLTYTGTDWAEMVLHGFNGPYGTSAIAATDGAYPYARAIIGPDGSLYGTTHEGARGGGTVYQLTRSGDRWTETVLHRFLGGEDGMYPYGDVIFDNAGNLYGTTVGGGSYRWGTVFQLSKSGSRWSKSILYSFQGGSDSGSPYAGIVFDKAGNLYGTTGGGGSDECEYSGVNCGTVFQLTRSETGWREKIIYNFHDHQYGGFPSGLIIDPAGNLYGTICESFEGVGWVFGLSRYGDSWVFHLLSSLPGSSCGFTGTLTLDSAGNLYGTTTNGGAYDRGTIYKLTGAGWWWEYTELYDFTGGRDGGEPNGNLVFDGDGNLYGTTQYGGVAHYCGGAPHTGCGVVFEIKP